MRAAGGGAARRRRPGHPGAGAPRRRGGEVFANGIHLHVIEAAPNPEIEAWRNIQAIDDVCREIITCTGQLVVASVGGNAGAGGVMLALGADRVLARAGVVLNPHYRTMGLYGSEYWSYVLPRRVGAHRAESLVGRCEPVAAEEAVRIGLVDEALAGPPAAFEEAVLEYAPRLATRADYARACWNASAPRGPPTSAAARWSPTAPRSSR